MYQRHLLERDHSVRATIVMTGGSLLSVRNETAIELEGKLINISQGGLCLTLDYDANWDILSSSKELEIHLSNGDQRCSTVGRVTHYGTDRSILGIKFHKPLTDLDTLLNPTVN